MFVRPHARADGLDKREAGERDATTSTPVARATPSWALALQRTVGNAAVAQMLEDRTGREVRTLARGENGTATATKPETKFRALGIQQALDDAKRANIEPTARQLEALQVLDTARSKGPWATLDWNPVANGAARRVLNPGLIDQHVLDLCGPAAALHASAGRDPMDYVNLVVEVFDRGTAAGKKVNEKLLAGERPRGETGQMPAVDWMVLSAMQDVTNTFFDYEGKPGDMAGGYFPPGMQDLLKDFSGSVKTTHYSCMLWGKEVETRKASKLLADHGDDVVVVIAVADQLLHKENVKPPMTNPPRTPNHFVRLLEPVVWSEDEVTTTVFTWGERKPIAMPPDLFERFVYGYTVGARSKEIAL